LRIVPAAWLTTQRVSRRIFQDTSAVDIVESLLAEYGGRLPALVRNLAGSHPPGEYITQYDESDFDFARRILADAGVGFLFDLSRASELTLVDDLASQATMLARPLPFVPKSDLVPGEPHVHSAAVSDAFAPGLVTLRDYDPWRPRLGLQDRLPAAPSADAGEALAEVYRFEPGKLADEAVGRAQRQLEALRRDRRRALFGTSVPLAPGTAFALEGRPQAPALEEWLVVRSRSDVQHGRAKHEIEAVPRDNGYRALMRRKPRAVATQTAFVVGPPGEEIDVDSRGRVRVEFRWDRRELRQASSRWVRVSQAWAGSGYGLSCLPRVGDEVVVDFLDGDPDQPIVVGRVHNAINVPPLDLPAEKAISRWRSRSTPGGGGFNEIALDDAAGAERIVVHAQRDLVATIEHDAHVDVGHDVTGNIKRHFGGSVGGNGDLSLNGDANVNIGGDLTVTAANITGLAADIAWIAGGKRLDISADHTVNTGTFHVRAGLVQFVTPHFHVFSGDILLTSGGARIHIKGGNIAITGGSVTIDGGVVDVKGTPIKLNS
jgi:type VI secretion system secreted protein VgrG